MYPTSGEKLTIFQRHGARRLAIWNGAIWAVGNGLASTTLVIYLARELHAEQLGLSIGFLVAMPQIVGLLRLGAPAMINRLGNRKRFCLATFLLGALVLLALPVICAPGRLPSPAGSRWALILLWCLYHLLQYFGMVGLWAWMADVAPLRIRGRFLGRRERWLVAGQAAAAVVAGLFVWGFSQSYPKTPSWLPYGMMAALGAVFMIAALVPLILMPAAEKGKASVSRVSQCHPERSEGSRKSRRFFASLRMTSFLNSSPLLKPFLDARFLRLLAFGCWFSFFNGVTQSAQNYYPMQILGASLFLSLVMPTIMRLGQLGISPRIGAMADRFGNRRVMIVSQLIVAAGLLCFAAATPARWGWFLGAWVLWIAYAGLNVCLPNLMLKLSPERSNAAYIAAFYAVTGLCYAMSTIVGGVLVDAYGNEVFPLPGGYCVGFFPSIFICGWAARSFGAVLLLLVIEPADPHANDG